MSVCLCMFLNVHLWLSDFRGGLALNILLEFPLEINCYCWNYFDKLGSTALVWFVRGGETMSVFNIFKFQVFLFYWSGKGHVPNSNLGIKKPSIKIEEGCSVHMSILNHRKTRTGEDFTSRSNGGETIYVLSLVLRSSKIYILYYL